MSETVRVVIADDHPVVLDGLRLLLGSLPGFVVVGEATTGREVTAQVDELQPDLVVMDLHMPDIDGIAATRNIVSRSPHVAILILTMFDDDDSVFAALRAGAGGYILKGAAQTEIVRALEAAASGEAIFSPAIARRVLAYFSEAADPRLRTAFPELTPRERKVLEYIAAGLNNTVIADRLGLQIKTIRNHVANVFTKLHVTDRAQAIIQAREAGLGRSERHSDDPGR